MRNKLNQMPVLKYSLIAGATVLWMLGLADQLPDLTQTATYVSISLLMVAFATI
jgi:hypothetical protein